MVRKLLKHLVLLCVGGGLYVVIELLWRGYTSPWMFLVGGICFILVGLINEVLPWDMNFVYQVLLGSVLILIVEFISGMVLNRWLGLAIWDYSEQPFNICGQVCLAFWFAWLPLTCVAIVLEDILHWKWFGEERPHYRFFNKSKIYWIGGPNGGC